MVLGRLLEASGAIERNEQRPLRCNSVGCWGPYDVSCSEWLLRGSLTRPRFTPMKRYNSAQPNVKPSDDSEASRVGRDTATAPGGAGTMAVLRTMGILPALVSATFRMVAGKIG